MAKVIKWEESSMQDIIHYFITTIVPKNPSGVLSSRLLSTTHTYSKPLSALNNIYSIHLKTKTMKQAAVLSLRCRWPSRAGGGYVPFARSDEKSMASEHRSPELQSGAHHKASPPLPDVWASAAKRCG